LHANYIVDSTVTKKEVDSERNEINRQQGKETETKVKATKELMGEN